MSVHAESSSITSAHAPKGTNERTNDDDDDDDERGGDDERKVRRYIYIYIHRYAIRYAIRMDRDDDDVWVDAMR